MSDDTVVRKRGRRPASEAPVEEVAPATVDTPVEERNEEAPVEEPTPAVDPEGILRPILAKARLAPTAPTLVEYVGTTLPKGMWLMTPVDKDTLSVAWGAWTQSFGAGDPERFLATVHRVLGLSTDSTVKAVHMLRLG